MDIRAITEKNAERRKKFSGMLKNGEPIEVIRTAAIEYFDSRIEETMQTIDDAWGEELQRACIMQQRYEERKEKVANAKTPEEIVSIVG